MFDRFILVGTSHSTPRWNPMKEEFEKIFNKPFSNRAIEALSIKTYFPRVLAIMDEFPNENLYFIMERPTSRRWEQYLINKQQRYVLWDICRHEFWPKKDENDEISNEGKWREHIFWYNIRRLLKINKITGMSYLKHKPPLKVIKSVLRQLALTNLHIENELSIVDALYINSFIKGAGHKVAWFIPQQIVFNQIKKSNDLDKKYDLEYITRTVLFDYIAHKKYKTTIENLKEDINVFPDGAHLNQDNWRFLIHEYFIPYFKNLNIPEK